jgi:hypothetical protein
MTPGPRTDEELDQLLAANDPVDRSLLTHDEVAAALERLHRAIATPERKPRRRRRLALSGALVGALAGGLLVLGALLPSADVHSGQFGAAPASAAIALDRAAKVAERRAPIFPTARQYQYLAVDEGSMGAGGMQGKGVSWTVNIWQSETKQDWFKPNGSGRERIIDTGRHFVTAEDQSIAHAHGKTLSALIENQSSDGTYQAGGITWSYVSPAGLPTNPAILLGAIKHKLLAHGMLRPASAEVFQVVGDLLFESNSPTLRSALYRALERLPKVELLGWQRDRIGRRGLELAIGQPGSHGGPSTREELLFNPRTSQVLQEQTVLAAPFRQVNAPALPAGTVMDETVFISRGIVNSITELPSGRQLPYHPSVGPGTR